MLIVDEKKLHFRSLSMFWTRPRKLSRSMATQFWLLSLGWQNVESPATCNDSKFQRSEQSTRQMFFNIGQGWWPGHQSRWCKSCHIIGYVVEPIEWSTKYFPSISSRSAKEVLHLSAIGYGRCLLLIQIQFSFVSKSKMYVQGTMEEKVYSRSVTKQAMSFRVVDEQQIDRHYNLAELSELYT